VIRNGSYSAWFRTQQGEGTGTVVLSDGKLTGGDNVSAYSGAYVVEGDTFRASVAARRHTRGQPSVFGIDNVDLTLIGKTSRTTASRTGTARQAPGLTFEATLVRMAD
jgi:T3SS negative regulator,GrlR